MRLTLRTLLAYRTGQLTDAEAAEIAARLARSPRAQLINRRLDEMAVRRLSLNLDSGDDSLLVGQGDARRLDANVVAGYLSDDLANDAVTEFERHCTIAYTQLDEVAACAQILAVVFTHPLKTDRELKTRIIELERLCDSAPISSVATKVWPASRPPPLPRRTGK